MGGVSGFVISTKSVSFEGVSAAVVSELVLAFVDFVDLRPCFISF